MADILEILNTISNAVYGKDVRQAIVDGISQCYTDGKAGVNDLEGRRLTESAIQVNESQQADIDTLYALIAEIQGGSGESSQESTSITLDTIIFDGGFVDSVSVANNATATYDVTFEKEFTEVPEVFACVAVQNSAGSAYSKVTVGIVKSQTTTTGFRFFIANTSGASRSVTVVWAAFQPTTQEIDLDITIPSGEGMTESEVREITNPIQTALNGVKTGYDGTVYSTPGEAVRTQINDLHVLIGDTPGTAIDASAIGYDDGNVEDALDGLNERLDGLGDGVPTEVRQAILTLLNSAVYLDAGLADERNVIASWAAIVTAIALNQSSISISGASTSQLVATTTPAGGAVTWASSDTNVATVSNSGLVTGVGNGTATITASCGGKTATCTVTVSGFATLSSIAAVYTPSGMVYDTDTLDSLKSNLVVTGTYSDSSTATITNYTLSGTLTVGTSIITVAYDGKTTTFNVTVVHQVVGWYYPFNDSIISAGTKDFGFSGVANYATGVNGNAYYHEVTTEGTSSTDVYGIKSVALSETPNLSGDFTLSFWHKSKTAKRGHPFSNYKSIASASFNTLTAPENIASGWAVTTRNASKTYAGLSLVWASEILGIRVFTGANATGGGIYNVTPPTSFDTTQWHHYALTRSGDTLMFFVDGSVIFTATLAGTIYFSDQVCIGNNFSEQSGNSTELVAGSYSDYVDDLYISEFCKWSAAFDPSTITY